MPQELLVPSAVATDFASSSVNQQALEGRGPDQFLRSKMARTARTRFANSQGAWRSARCRTRAKDDWRLCTREAQRETQAGRGSSHGAWSASAYGRPFPESWRPHPKPGSGLGTIGRRDVAGRWAPPRGCCWSPRRPLPVVRGAFYGFSPSALSPLPFNGLAGLPCHPGRSFVLDPVRPK
jgi:hypothetical protein